MHDFPCNVHAGNGRLNVFTTKYHTDTLLNSISNQRLVKSQAVVYDILSITMSRKFREEKVMVASGGSQQTAQTNGNVNIYCTA